MNTCRSHVSARWGSLIIVMATLFGAPSGSVTTSAQPGLLEEAIELTTPTGALAGTLVLPGRGGKVPVVLIIAGSGPTDRDGNSAALPGKNNAYKLLSEALAAGGVASVRYDKRGLGGSRPAFIAEADLRVGTLVHDAARWVARLRNDARFSTITVIGHSEGSLIGMLAVRAARADAFVSIAGTGRPAADVLREQLRPQLAASAELRDASERILSVIASGGTTADVPKEFTALYRPSVQPYLTSWFAYAPAVELGRLVVPTLVVQGTTDIQVAVTDADALKAAKSDAQLRVINGMNHVMKMVDADRGRQVASYSDPALPIAPELSASILTFIQRLGGRGMPRPRRPDGERRSLRDVVMAEVDGARLAIEYAQPSKRGRAIWGALVPWGDWWMPGADEASTLTTSAPLMFGELKLPAGDYTLYAAPNPGFFALIVSSEIGQFHTEYHPGRDVGRVPMTRTNLSEPVERMTYVVGPRAGGGGVLALRWDDREYSVAITAARN